MIFLLLALQLVAGVLAASLALRPKAAININPARANDSTGSEPDRNPETSVVCSAAIRAYMNSAEFRLNVSKYTPKGLPLNKKLDCFSTIMTCSHASYDFSSRFASFVPFSVKEDWYEKLVVIKADSFTLSQHPDTDLFIHFDDVILDWGIRYQKRFLALQTRIPFEMYGGPLAINVIRFFHKDLKRLANFDGICLRYLPDSREVELVVLTRYTEIDSVMLGQLNASQSSSFVVDTDFNLSQSRAKIVNRLKWMFFIKKHLNPKGRKGSDGPSTATTPFMGKQPPSSPTKKVVKAKESASAPSKPQNNNNLAYGKVMLLKRTESAPSNSAATPPSRTDSHDNHSHSSQFSDGIYPPKRSISPTIKPRAAPKAINQCGFNEVKHEIPADPRKKWNPKPLGIDNVPNIHRKNFEPGSVRILKRTPVIPKKEPTSPELNDQQLSSVDSIPNDQIDQIRSCQVSPKSVANVPGEFGVNSNK